MMKWVDGYTLALLEHNKYRGIIWRNSLDNLDCYVETPTDERHVLSTCGDWEVAKKQVEGKIKELIG